MRGRVPKIVIPIIIGLALAFIASRLIFRYMLDHQPGDDDDCFIHNTSMIENNSKDDFSK